MRAAVPVARLLLAALLVFGGEILLWQDPLSRSPLEWLMVAAGYTAIACLLLEIAARFRWREIYGLLALAGIYALLNAVLINPTLSFADFPRTLFTRVLGAQALTGALMLAAWRWLLIPPRRPSLVPLLLCAITGAGWGIWARWSASLFRGDAVLRDTPFMTIAIIGLIALALIAGLRLALMRAAGETSLTSAHFHLGRAGWLFTASTLITLGIVQIGSGLISGIELGLCAALALICLGTIYYQKRAKGRTFFDDFAPGQFHFLLYGILTAVLLAAAALTYPLPRGDGENDPVFVIATAFTAYGIAWLPGIALAIGVRGFIRQVQAHRL
jgi:hypothetical protein